MNTVKKISYSTIGLGLSSLATLNTFAQGGASETTFGVNKATTTSQNLENRSLPEAVQFYVNFLMTFLYLIAVMFALWGGFQILTAGGDDDKVKKGKTILIQGAMGLLVIWLAGTIVKWVLSVLVA
ncbi:hypothetical protein H3C61_00760 [Candidatus Gracilibacteria bacterium]|nr:hypothetical protein [Candidatus Gracilibacteria bacterium]